jgi:Protein of unknown function (DUF2892)
MVRNLGTIERLARIIAGIVLLGLFGALPAPWRYLTLIGLMPLGTGLLGHCPVYRTLGWKRDGHSRSEPPLLVYRPPSKR